MAEEISWRDSNQWNMKYARVNMTNPTFGEVTIALFEDEGELRYLVISPNVIFSVRVIVAHKLMRWIEEFFKICKSYLKIEKFQMTKGGMDIYVCG